MSSNAPLASPVGPAKGPAVCFNRLRSSDPSASIKGLAWTKPWATPGAARLPAAAPPLLPVHVAGSLGPLWVDSLSFMDPRLVGNLPFMDPRLVGNLPFMDPRLVASPTPLQRRLLLLALRRAEMPESP